VGQALSLIKGRNLNPLANEVYIVAYKNRNGGTEFSLIVSKEAFLKRAAQSKNYEGFEAGVVAVDKDGVMHERKKTRDFLTKGETNDKRTNTNKRRISNRLAKTGRSNIAKFC